MFNLFFHVSVQFSHSVVSDSLGLHESQHARPPCPSPTPGVHSNSCPSSRWCHPAISSSVIPISSCPQFLPASVFSNESTLRMRWPKYWSFSFSISPSNEPQDWSSLERLVGTPCSPRDSQESSPTLQFESINSLALSLLYGPALTSIHMIIGKTIALTIWIFDGKVMSLLFNMLRRFKHLLISWCNHCLQWFKNPPNKIFHYFHYSPFYLPWSDRTRFHDLSFLIVEF